MSHVLNWFPIVLAFVGLFAVGLILIGLGLSGRRVGDHPHCRRCGFDLFGKPVASTNCPECGIELSKPKSIQIGRRSRRRAPLVGGAVLLLLLVACGGAAGWFAAQGADWIRTVPTFWLVHQAYSANLAIRGPALDELIRRDRTSALSPSQHVTLADAAMRYQTDPTTRWDPRWSELVIDARQLHVLDDARWGAYVTALSGQAGAVDTSRSGPAVKEL